MADDFEINSISAQERASCTMPKPMEPDLLEILRKTETGSIGHFLDTGFIAPGIRAPDARCG
jgi:hypothetical protein